MIPIVITAVLRRAASAKSTTPYGSRRATKPTPKESPMRKAARELTKSRSHGIDWDAQPLGKVSDRAIADALGVRANLVAAARIARGIPVLPRSKGSRSKDRKTEAEDYQTVRSNVVAVSE